MWDDGNAAGTRWSDCGRQLATQLMGMERASLWSKHESNPAGKGMYMQAKLVLTSELSGRLMKVEIRTVLVEQQAGRTIMRFVIVGSFG